MSTKEQRFLARKAERKVLKAIEKYHCLHCQRQATRRRRRQGTKHDVPLCENMRCLRAEWAVEDAG